RHAAHTCKQPERPNGRQAVQAGRKADRNDQRRQLIGRKSRRIKTQVHGSVTATFYRVSSFTRLPAPYTFRNASAIARTSTATFQLRPTTPPSPFTARDPEF